MPEKQFKEAIDDATTTLLHNAQSARWFGPMASAISNFSPTPGYIENYSEATQRTFIQALVVEPNNDVVIIGDLHGD